MSKPVHGDDPTFDERLRALTVQLDLLGDHRKLKGGDKKVLKDLKRATQHFLAEVDFTLLEKVEQSIGGVLGALHTLKNSFLPPT